MVCRCSIDVNEAAMVTRITMALVLPLSLLSPSCASAVHASWVSGPEALTLSFSQNKERVLEKLTHFSKDSGVFLGYRKFSTSYNFAQLPCVLEELDVTSKGDDLAVQDPGTELWSPT